MLLKQRLRIGRKFDTATKIRRLAVRRVIGRHRKGSVLRNAILRRPQVSPVLASEVEGKDTDLCVAEEQKLEASNLLESVCLRPDKCPDVAPEVLPCPETVPSMTCNRNDPGSNFVFQLVPVTFPVSSLRSMNISLRYLYKNVVSNEDQCVQWLASRGLLRNEQICTTCGVAVVLTKDRACWRCRNCKIKMSLRRKSFFKEKRLPLTTILELLYWWSLDTTQSIIFREVGICRATAGTWFQYCQQLCEQFFKDHPCHLGGPGKEVEVDIRDFPCIEEDNSVRVLGMVERESKNVFLTVLPSKHPRSSMPFIEKVVQPGSKVISSAASTYGKLCSRPDLDFAGPEEVGFSTDAVSRLWRCVQDSFRRKVVRKELVLIELKEIQFRLLMGDRLFGELLYWLDFYHW